MLYRCADCGRLYTTATKGSDLFCTACGAVHHLDNSYRFTDSIGSIPAYYDRIKELERAELDSLALTAEVNVRIFPDKERRVKKEKGVCTLNREAFTFTSDSVRFSIPTEKIPALAFSCDKEFELYHKNDQYYLYPVENRRQVARWSLIIDLLREERSG